MSENGMDHSLLERFQKEYGREQAKALVAEQVKLLSRNLGLVEAYQLGLYESGKTTDPEWEQLLKTIQDGREKLEGLKKVKAEIEAQEVAERVKP